MNILGKEIMVKARTKRTLTDYQQGEAGTGNVARPLKKRSFMVYFHSKAKVLCSVTFTMSLKNDKIAERLTA